MDPVIFAFVPDGCLGLKLNFLSHKFFALLEEDSAETKVRLQITEGDLRDEKVLTFTPCFCLNCIDHRKTNLFHPPVDTFYKNVFPTLDEKFVLRDNFEYESKHT